MNEKVFGESSLACRYLSRMRCSSHHVCTSRSIWTKSTLADTGSNMRRGLLPFRGKIEMGDGGCHSSRCWAQNEEPAPLRDGLLPALPPWFPGALHAGTLFRVPAYPRPSNVGRTRRVLLGHS